MIRVVKWRETFENAESRKLQTMKWFASPAGVESCGYVELMSHGTPGVIAFAVFQAMCQLTATLSSAQRGTMCRTDGTPMNYRQIANQIRMATPVVEDAISLLTSEGIQWLEVAESPTLLPESPTHLPDSSQSLPAYNCIDNNNYTHNYIEKEQPNPTPFEKPEAKQTALPGAAPAEPRGEVHSSESKSSRKKTKKPPEPFMIPDVLAEHPGFAEAWAAWEQYRGEIKKPLALSTRNSQLVMLARHGPVKAIAMMQTSITNGWAGLFPDDATNGRKSGKDTRPACITRPTNTTKLF